ncbi:kinase-like domain-containing protein [Crassisporium funariophilum]|nr:kinase-like domain-containing protein [Crassisporium funariophilum]
MHADAFDVIPYEDIKGNWKKLGSGSFGNVYKGTYLGIDVAIKEVLPSTEYDVGKYFEREWRLMKECRHPNICLFIGLSRAPAPDNRIFIISEYIENGNVRIYIHDKTKPFPWRVRLSFATDVARALAYLHARKCIHRDLKGENLLVTSNGRLKVTDFGFARIAARNEEESKRLTFCGTDSYMSPEILLGDEFDLPTDIFSLGIIFCEIGARKLADDNHFKRTAPSFGINEDEARSLMSPGCPSDFLQLCLECLNTKPEARPTTRDILERLRAIEAEVLLRPSEGDDVNVGSVRFMTGGKRPTAGPRIPSFGMGVGKGIRSSETSTDSDDELMEAINDLSTVHLSSGWSDSSLKPLLNRDADSPGSEYSTTVIRSHGSHLGAGASPPSLSSILTIKPSPDPNHMATPILPATPPRDGVDYEDPLGTSSIMSIATLDSYHTAASDSAISSTYATEGGSTIRSLHGNYVAPLVHRFTLLKPGKQKRQSGSVSPNGNTSEAAGWNPLEMLFSSGLLVAKCDLCNKRLGWKPVLECDDCGLRTHVKCGEIAPRDCGIRVSRPGAHQSPLNLISPLSKVKQSAAHASEEMKNQSKSSSPARR